MESELQASSGGKQPRWLRCDFRFGCLKPHPVPVPGASHWSSSALPSLAHRPWGCEPEPRSVCLGQDSSILPLKLLLLLQQEALQATVTLAEVRTGTGRPGAQAGLGERSLHGQPGFQVLPIRLTQSSQARTRLL